MSQTTPPRAEWVTFGSAFEAMFVKALSAQMTPVVKAELKALGVNLDKIDAAYPYETWLKSLAITARLIFPGQPLDKSYTFMGQRLVESFFETFLGRPVLAIMRLVGPERGLQRMTKNFRTSNNYSTTEVTDRGNGEFEMWVNEAGDSRFITLGLLRRGMQLAGSEKVVVEVISTDDQGTRFSIKL